MDCDLGIPITVLCVLVNKRKGVEAFSDNNSQFPYESFAPRLFEIISKAIARGYLSVMET